MFEFDQFDDIDFSPEQGKIYGVISGGKPPYKLYCEFLEKFNLQDNKTAVYIHVDHSFNRSKAIDEIVCIGNYKNREGYYGLLANARDLLNRRGRGRRKHDLGSI